MPAPPCLWVHQTYADPPVNMHPTCLLSCTCQHRRRILLPPPPPSSYLLASLHTSTHHRRLRIMASNSSS
jgi:hypothetical protein